MSLLIDHTEIGFSSFNSASFNTNQSCVNVATKLDYFCYSDMFHLSDHCNVSFFFFLFHGLSPLLNVSLTPKLDELTH